MFSGVDLQAQWGVGTQVMRSLLDVLNMRQFKSIMEVIVRV